MDIEKKAETEEIARDVILPVFNNMIDAFHDICVTLVERLESGEITMDDIRECLRLPMVPDEDADLSK